MNYYLRLLVQSRQTTDKQKAIHKSQPCNLHRRAQKRTGREINNRLICMSTHRNKKGYILPRAISHVLQATGQLKGIHSALLVHSPFSAQNEHKSLLSTQFSGKIGIVGSVVRVVVGRVASMVLLGVASLVLLGVASIVLLGVASLVLLGVASLVLLGVASLVLLGVAFLVLLTVASLVLLGVASLVLLGVASLVLLGSTSPEPSSVVGLVAGGPVVESLMLVVVLSRSRSQVLHDTGQFKLIQSELSSHSSVKAQNEHKRS